MYKKDFRSIIEVSEMGLFGTAAPILIDINLVLQYITLILLVVGYIKKKPFKTHGYIMLSMLLITVGTTLLVMAPRLLMTYTSYGPTVIVHASFGIVCILLGTLFSYRFITAVRNEKPLLCGTKNMMRLAFILWLVPILAGTMMYVALYV